MFKFKITLCFLAMCFCLTDQSVQADPAVSFWPSRTDFSIGVGTSSLQAADFNNDGKEDLVVVNQSNSNVLILLNDGSGSYNNSGNTAGFTNMWPIAIGDFNNDGNADLAASNFSTSRVQIFLGNGQGILTQGSNIVITSSLGMITAGDFNNDNNIDLAVGGSGSNIVNILLGDGLGAFPTALTAVAGLSNVRYLNRVDLNNDGNDDLITYSYPGTNVSAMIGNGNGTFGTPVISVTGLTQNILSLESADFNCDGIADLAVVSDKLSIMFGNGQGGFSTSNLYNDSYDELVITDLNRDGWKDLVAARMGNFVGGKITVYLGNMSGVFVKDKSYSTGIVPAFSGRNGILSHDVNGDHNSDIIFINYTAGENFISTMLGDGTGKLKNFVELNTGTVSYGQALVSDDFNNDGKADIVRAGGSFIDVFVGDGQGGFLGPNRSPINFVANILLNSDFNRDGNKDLVITGFTPGVNEAIYVMLGNGNGTFSFYASYPLTNFAYRTEKGDFNNDQKDDVLVMETFSIAPPQNVYLYLGDGLGGFSLNGTFTAQQSRDLTVADFNNDSNLDWLTINSATNSISLFSGNGQGGFTNITSPIAVTSPHRVTSADLNRDGNIDLVVAYIGAANINTKIFLGNGAGGFVPGNSIDAGSFIEKIIVLDCNNDGLKDIVGLNRQSHNISLLFGDGIGGYANAQYYGVGIYPWVIAAADFNSDGKVDIAVPDEFQQVSLLFNNIASVYANISTNYNQLPPGGTLSNILKLNNVTAQPQTFHLLLVTVLPNNTVRPELFLPNFTMSANQSISVNYPWAIPQSTPLGVYSQQVWIGTSLNDIWDVGAMDYEVKYPVYCPAF